MSFVKKKINLFHLFKNSLEKFDLSERTSVNETKSTLRILDGNNLQASNFSLKNLKNWELRIFCFQMAVNGLKNFLKYKFFLLHLALFEIQGKHLEDTIPD